ncbi:DUF4276 family protein [Trichocoleus sp. FACHB-90]|uniref:DUF4276 family protein n=1 Tax=Cyanophyceae TaxID=3028117 RepID=UPI0016824F7D|nr:DUF4276 family protein [Trichocoleus sp. FACHB-90]MBD1928597.1 DUF4276 family protein [Trichocoleus sp. FACHB-90]
MKELCYTLLSDGSSDKALMFLLSWLLQQHLIESAIQPQWADIGRLPNPPKTLSGKIKSTLDLAPCNLLFVHRDAEKETREKRVAEIRAAIDEAVKSVQVPPAVCVVPVHMTEAWLLFNEIALRTAADNPRGRQPLQLPPITKLEELPDPKNVLYDLLRQASGLGTNKLKRFRVNDRVHRLAEGIDDFSPLRALPAFQALEVEIKQVIQEQSW